MLRRRSLLTTVVLMAGSRMLSQEPARAFEAEATPAAEPEVVIVDATAQYFAVKVVPELPAGPVVVSLRRLTLLPDASFSLRGEPQSVPLILIESGAVMVRAKAPLAVIRGGPGGDRDASAAGAELTAGAGDYLAGPGQELIEARNTSAGPSSLLVLRIEPAGPGTPVAAPPPGEAEGVEVLILAEATTDKVPPAPALLELMRFAFQPGGYVQLPDTSPATALIVVETGEMTVEMGAPATVQRSRPGSAEPRQDDYAANTAFTVSAGQSMIGQPYAAVNARNNGVAPLSILMAVMQPAPPA